MAGPYPPPHDIGAYGPPPQPGHPGHPPQPGPYPAAQPLATYPDLLPPPVAYPKYSRRPLIIAGLLTVVLVAALVAAIVYAVRNDRSTAPLSAATATAAIQSYLDALSDRDVDIIARNTLCGIYDAVGDRRSDEALAKLSSDAFRKQFGTAEVTSIDKIVALSTYQAQVLFTMRVTAAAGGDPRDGVQGIAQLLTQGHQILVCSYVLRTAGTY